MKKYEPEKVLSSVQAGMSRKWTPKVYLSSRLNYWRQLISPLTQFIVERVVFVVVFGLVLFFFPKYFQSTVLLKTDARYFSLTVNTNLLFWNILAFINSCPIEVMLMTPRLAFSATLVKTFLLGLLVCFSIKLVKIIKIKLKFVPTQLISCEF